MKIIGRLILLAVFVSVLTLLKAPPYFAWTAAMVLGYLAIPEKAE